MKATATPNTAYTTLLPSGTAYMPRMLYEVAPCSLKAFMKVGARLGEKIL